jgi:hypothetical protein
MAEARPVIHVAPCFRFSPVGAQDQRTRLRAALDLAARYLAACHGEEGRSAILADLDYLRPLLALFSEERSFLRGLVTLQRFDASASYGQPAQTFVGGESLVRSLVYGRHYLEGMLGLTPAGYLSLGSPGLCPQFPQLLAKTGFEAMVWGTDRTDLPPLCSLLAPDGSQVLLKPEPGLYQPRGLDEFIATLTEGLGQQVELGLNHDLRLLGGEMTPPPDWLSGRLQELADLDPAVLISTPQRYLSAVRADARRRRPSLPLLAADPSRPPAADLLARADLKSAARLADNRLLAAEKWATLAGLIGAHYPDRALDKAWRLLLYCQHYSALTGRIVDIPYLDLLASLREAAELAAEVERRALAYLSTRIATRKARGAPRHGASLVVFNSLCWPRTDICHAIVPLEAPLASGFQLTDDRGRAVPFQVLPSPDAPDSTHPAVRIAFLATDIPSLGYRTYYLKPGPALPPTDAPKPADTATIENQHYSITASAALGGGIVSLRDKDLGLELINSSAGPANELLAIAEPPGGDAPSRELETTGGVIRSRTHPAQLSVTNGPVLSRLRIETQLADRGRVVQEVTLYRGLRRIDFCTRLHDYRGDHETIALSFPLALANPTPTFGDRFAAVVRPPGPAGSRISGLAPAHDWLDAGPAPSLWITAADGARRALPLTSCAIITSSHVHGHAALPALLQALLARGVTATHRLDSAEGDSACALHISLGRDNAYSKRALIGQPEASAALTAMLSKTPWAAVLVPGPAGAPSSPPVLVADAAGPGGLPGLLEMLASAIASDQLSIPAACDFCRTARPSDNRGLALLTGNAFAAGLDTDGVLLLPLFRTAAWEGHPWGQGNLGRFLVPEHRTHVFSYSLLPHRGDWREAGVIRAAAEPNNPLIAVDLPLQEGPLPADFSLVTADRPDVAITSVKPAGDPLAQHRDARRSLAEREIVLRAHEPHGAARAAHLTFASQPEAAWLCDLMERKTSDLTVTRGRRGRPGEVPLQLGSCEVATLAVRLSPLPGAPSQPEELGPSAEPGQPIYVRWWEHNLGVAPLGNQPVTIWMRGVLPRGKNTRFALGISNDSLDRDLTGSVGIAAPATWTLIPRQVPYRITAGSQALYEIMIAPPADAPSCFLRAIIQDGDQLYQDIIPIGDVQPLALTVAREANAFSVTIENPNGDHVEGQVVLITPLESWGAAASPLAVAAVSPRLYAFTLQPQARQTLRFTVRGDMNSLWAAAKVMWYGNVQYALL